MKKEFTNYYDDDDNLIFVGNKLKCKHGYEIIVRKGNNGYYGELICDESNSCKDIPYHLNNGRGYVKI
ncbi:MAG: hypothetical protein HQ541_18665, partial [Mariniphaga sp.]|nr:hypothetical protein [Mariniphaga sp.]